MAIVLFLCGVFCVCMALVAAVSVIFAWEDKSIGGVILGVLGSPACATMGAIFLSFAAVA